MKKTNVRRPLAALVLALVLVAALPLSACQKKAPASPDQVAEAVYQMTFQQSAEKMRNLFGYQSDDQAKQEWLGEEGDFLGAVSGAMVDQFQSMGLDMKEEELDSLVDATINMLSKLEFSAEVSEMDEKAKTATVIGHVGYYDPETVNAEAEALVNRIMGDMDQEALLTEEGVMEFFRQYLDGYAQLISNLEPAEGTKDIEVPFELVETEINGKTQSVWMPADSEQFGFDLSVAALGA